MPIALHFKKTLHRKFAHFKFRSIGIIYEFAVK